MTPHETARLLTLIVGLDPRLATDDRGAQIRTAAWADMLTEASYDQAASAVRRYYRDPDNRYPITINDVASSTKRTPTYTAADLPAIGQPMPDEVRASVRRDPGHAAARRIACPWHACRAPIGQACTVSGVPMRNGAMHPSRHEAVRAAA